MEHSMEQWMEAQHPADDQLTLHPTVLDELYRDTLEAEHLSRCRRMGRSKSLPPEWE